MLKKRISCVIALGLCISLLGGCGGLSTDSKAQKRVGDKTVVTIFHHIEEQSAREGLEEVIKKLEEKNPGVDYELQGLDNSQYDTMLKTKLVGGDAPDIIMGTPKRYVEFIEAGHIYDISGEDFLKNYDDELLDSMKVDGKTYSVPTNCDSMGCYYNKKVFEENNLTVPKTHEELMGIAKVLEDKGIYPFARGFQDGWTAQVEIQADLYGSFLSDNPEFFKNITEEKKQFSDYPGFKEVMQRTADRLSFDGGDEFGTDAAKARNMLINGGAGMYMGGPWDISEFIKVNAGSDIGFFPIPGNDQGEPILGIAPAGCYMITEASEHKKEAVEFIKYLTSDEGISILNKYSPFVPVTVSEDEIQNYTPLVQDWVKPILAGNFYNYESNEIFTGQADSTFRTWQEEFASDEKRDVVKYIEKLDEEFAAIQ